MACTLGSIAAERLWAPLLWGPRHAGVGAPFSVLANRSVLVPLRSGSGGWGNSAAGGGFAVGAGLQGRMARTVPSFDLSYRAVQPERMCPTCTRTSVG